MTQGFYTVFYLLLTAFSARRDARIKFLAAENQILRDRLGAKRVILSPRERCRMLALGKQFNH